MAIVTLTAHTHAFGANESILWNFGSGADGTNPYAGLILDASGNLYGTTQYGGANAGPSTVSPGAGTVFELTPPAVSGGTWTESILWNFDWNQIDGYKPSAGLITDTTSGKFYGTTAAGGIYRERTGAGTVFELTPPVTSGGAWTESILWDFGNGTDGQFPEAGLTMDGSGNLYGTTTQGGTNSAGTVFKLASGAGGTWSESVLYSFGANSTDGQNPFASLLIDSNQNLYGTTSNGGVNSGGTVFKLSPPSSPGGTWTESVLYSFGGVADDDSSPYAGLTIDTSGNLYGTTRYGGAFGTANTGGTVFKLVRPSVPGGAWTETLLWSFGDRTDGFIPYAGVVLDPSSGNFYGTTAGGGTADGAVFELTNSSPGQPWSETVLWNFGSGIDGGQPDAAPILGPNSGKLYGTTFAGGTNAGGTVFAISNIVPTATPTATATATATPTPTVTPTPTPTVVPTPVPTPMPTPLGPAALTLSPKTFAFGNVDYAVAGSATKVRKLTITNPKKYATAAIISSLSGTAGFTADPACTNVTIAPGGKLVCTVTYAPTGLGGVSGTLTINDNVAGGAQTIGVSGSGIQGRLATSPGTLNFGKVPLNTTSAAKTVTLRNRTASTFTISSITNGNPAFAASQSCVVPLGTTTCAVSVTYTPTVTTKVTDTLTITDQPDGITRTVNLIGTGK